MDLIIFMAFEKGIFDEVINPQFDGNDISILLNVSVSTFLTWIKFE
jgi:hypothetical protein